MSLKLIAIGNRFMGDDAVAIHVAEKLRGSLETKGIEVIIGETDFEYCLDKIEDKDQLILMDATCFGIQPGAITVKSIDDINSLTSNKSAFSQHGYSLISAFKSYFSELDIFIIGIEGSKFDYGISLSSSISSQLNNICHKVEEICSDCLIEDVRIS